jgi:NTP pyrophosphatase (non-canonical NTP hydrolase)
VNQLRDEIYRVIDTKGHHSVQHTQREALTFRQLNHLFIEACEAYQHFRELRYTNHTKNHLEAMAEELADVLIVAFDLCALHQIDLTILGQSFKELPTGILEHTWEELLLTIGDIADQYRKTRQLKHMPNLMTQVALLMRRHGAEPIEEVNKKMARNKKRPARYGLVEAGQ